MSDQAQTAGFSTLAIHAGARSDDEAATRAAPIYQTADFALGYGAASPFASQARGQEGAHPANAILEERIAALEGGSAALAVASGPAARLLVLAALLRPGDEFIAARSRPDGSTDDLAHAVQSFGWIVRWADPARRDSFVDALGERTKAIVCESITTDGTVTDLDPIATLARRARVPLIVDNTLATPYLTRPLECGADIVLHCGTHVLAGHRHVTGGLIIDGGSFDWLQDDRYPALSQPSPVFGGTVVGETFGNFAFATVCRELGVRHLGPAPAPSDAALILAGIETLPLRMRRHCENALAVAGHLHRHAAVRWVRYAGLAGDRGHAVARRTCPAGAGAVVTFGMEKGTAATLAGRLRLFTESNDLGATRSLVTPLGRAVERNGGDRDGDAQAMRLSIGLEDAADLVADLDGALAHALAG